MTTSTTVVRTNWWAMKRPKATYPLKVAPMTVNTTSQIGPLSQTG